MNLTILGSFLTYLPAIAFLYYVLVTGFAGYILWLIIKVLRNYLND
jgi:hypothetical protein